MGFFLFDVIDYSLIMMFGTIMAVISAYDAYATLKAGVK